MNESLSNWIDKNLLKCYVYSDDIVTIDDKYFLIIKDKYVEYNNGGDYTKIVDESKSGEPNVKNILFDEGFCLILNDKDLELADKEEVQYFLFEFGDNWYYYGKNDKPELNLFKYIGKANIDQELNFPFLGLHGKYEICNGSRDYKDWVKKAKFLGIKTLGIVEQQTLAGTYNFQLACKEADIKAIHGQTAKVKGLNNTYYNVKIYVKNSDGWQNLLKINKIQIVDRVNDNNHITESELIKLSNGLYIVFCSDVDLDNVSLDLYPKIGIFFQVDPVEWKYDSRERDYLINQKKYLDKYYLDVLPIIINDAYYLDQEDCIIKPILNKILNISNSYQSDDQYFKPSEVVINQWLSLFNSDDDRAYDILSLAIDCAELIAEESDFKITRTDIHLPKYEMNKNESDIYLDNLDLFYGLIEEGMLKKIIGKVDDEEIYYQRLEKEINVLSEGNVIDYFLILSDIVKWCESHEILPGLGRGSAAGSLVAYLLGIVSIDPIKYDLLFERFLNKARLLGGSLPDIDFDSPSNARQDIIQYIVDKYGKEHVAFIGTSFNFKLKSTIKDLARMKGMDHSSANFLTSLISKEYDLAKTTGLFEIAAHEPKLKELIQKYPDIIQIIDLMIFQPRSFGIHAAAVVISPKFDKNGDPKTIFDYLPIRISDGNYVTEWEKEAVEEVGMLKEDMLGLKQLDKIMLIRSLIKESGIKPPIFEEIDLADPKVYELFQQGITEDVFQFNTKLQKQYCIELQPTNIDDLINANALLRPGAMETNSHRKYIKLKDGEEILKLPTGLEDITRKTFGLTIFQEQVMVAFQKCTNCDLNEADNFRKIISKNKPGKKMPDIEKYEKIFKDAYIKITDQEEVDMIWDMMIGFAKYGFNLAHSTCYAITGYWACWFKCHYPVEFYAASLGLCEKEENLKTIIAEINDSKLVNLKSPDINKSLTKYSIDRKTNSIYWSLSSIKYAGDIAVDAIIEDRNTNGLYYSFDEFLHRMDGKKVNIRVISNLIICGAFDEIERFTDAIQRRDLLKKFLDKKYPEELSGSQSDQEHFWILKQKELCGLGDIDFKNIYQKNKTNFTTAKYTTPEKLQEKESLNNYVTLVGILVNAVERVTKRGKMGQIELDHNGEKLFITAWSDFWEPNSNNFKNSKNKIVMISGMVKHDGFKKYNVINTSEKSKYTII